MGLRWLSVQNQIKQSTLSCMYRQYRYETCLKLNPPIQFGTTHSHSTRTNRQFANIMRFSTAFGQKSFHCKGTTWGNTLPPDFYQMSGYSYHICAESPGLLLVIISFIISFISLALKGIHKRLGLYKVLTHSQGNLEVNLSSNLLHMRSYYLYA